MMKIVSFLRNTECRVCHSALVLKEKASAEITLDIDGNVVTHTSEYEGGYLHCPKCKAKYEYVTLPDGKFKIYTQREMDRDISKIVFEYDFEKLFSPFLEKGDE